AGMRRLNRDAAAALRAAGAATHAVTDVTGYGLAGHAWEVAERSGATLRLDGPVLPAYPGVRAAAAPGVRTGGGPPSPAYVAGPRPPHAGLRGGRAAGDASRRRQERTGPRSPDLGWAARRGPPRGGRGSAGRGRVRAHRPGGRRTRRGRARLMAGPPDRPPSV